MTRCANCNEKWTKETKLKGLTTIERGIKCPSCGVLQYESYQSFLNTFIVCFGSAAILIVISSFFDVSMMFIIFGALILILINFLYGYFSASLSNTDEVYDRILGIKSNEK